MRLNQVGLMLIIVAFMWWFYHPVLTTYFSQDDFFHFKLAQQNPGLTALINFEPFNQRGVAFYRPLSRELLYGWYYQLFGLEVWPFRLIAMTLGTINVGLVWWLFRRWIHWQAGLIVALFYAWSASNVAVLYYLAGGIQAQLAVFWSMLSLLLIDRFFQTRRWGWWFGALGCWILALMCHELALITLAVMGLRWWSSQNIKLSRQWVDWWWLPFLILSLSLLSLEIFKVGYDRTQPQYALHFSLKTTLNTLVWYFGWAIGLPEMLIDFTKSGLKLDPNLMKYWGNYYRFIFPSFGLTVMGLGTMLGYLLMKRDRQIWSRQFLILVIWFPLAVIPVLLLPEHKSTYYLAFANVGLAGVIGLIGWRFLASAAKLKYFLAGLVLISFGILSASSSQLGANFYWAAGRGRLAEAVIKSVTSQNPVVLPTTVIYLTNDPSYPFVSQEWGGTSKQAALAINRGDGLRLYYHLPKLSVYFEDLGGLPNEVDQSQVKTIMVKKELFN